MIHWERCYVHDFTETLASVVPQNPHPSFVDSEHLVVHILLTIAPLAAFLLVDAALVFVQKVAECSTGWTRM